MNQELFDELGKEEVSPFHQKLLTHCRELVDQSRSVMSKNYEKWDTRDEVYRAVRKMDRKDRESAKNNEPVKMTVPLTTAQVNTFIAFAFMVLHQRRNLFELEPVGDEDHPLREPGEKLLENDLRHSQFILHEFQFWLDIARFGLGIFKHGWVKKSSNLMVDPQPGIDGELEETEGRYKSFVRFEGNQVQTVSPYRFFPDTRLPLTRFQEGEFCACEDEYTKVALQQMESDMSVAGVKHIQQFESDRLALRQEQSRFNQIDLMNAESTGNLICVTECQVRLVPGEFEVDGKYPLGKEMYPVMYLVWYANDSRVIKAEPMTAYHDSFSYEVAQMTPDQHHNINQSLSEIIGKLQGSVDWFINSRIASVKRTLDNQLIVDPSVVDMRTLENRSRVILLQRGVARAGIDRYVRPLPVTDVTGKHLDDASILTNLTQSVTGISDNALGQYHTGRRSATEARAVTQGSSSRLMSVISLIWTAGYVPLGQKMLCNHRQYLQPERYEKVLGTNIQVPFDQFHGDAATLVGSADFFIYEGTLPSEKQFLAQSLQEILNAILSNPQAAAAFGLDAKALIQEIYTLRGVGNLQRFAAQQGQQLPADIVAALMQQTQQPSTQGNVQ